MALKSAPGLQKRGRFDVRIYVSSVSTFFILTSRMTAKTIREIPYFLVFVLHFSLVVAGVACPGGEGNGVAITAGGCVLVINGEGMCPVEEGRNPGGCVVTFAATCAE